MIVSTQCDRSECDLWHSIFQTNNGARAAHDASSLCHRIYTLYMTLKGQYMSVIRGAMQCVNTKKTTYSMRGS